MRFYEPDIKSSNLSKIYHLSKENAHHFSRVLRGRVGQVIHLFNGRQGCFSAEVIKITREETSVLIQEYSPENHTPRVSLNLVFGITDKQKMSLIVEKAVELGVSEIFPVITERTQTQYEKHFDDLTMQRYLKIMISAAAQSGINQLAKIYSPTTLEGLPWQDWQEDQQKCYVCHPHGADYEFNTSDRKRVIFIGPEGGWSAEELRWLDVKACKKIQLARSVLRMETAVIAALARAQ